MMMLATTTVEDFDRFLKIFSTKGAEKRRQHGSKGATVFRDPNEDDRVWVIFDWDAEGWQSFVSDPEVPRSCKRPGTKVSPRRRRSADSTTPSTSPRAGVKRRRDPELPGAPRAQPPRASQDRARGRSWCPDTRLL